MRLFTRFAKSQSGNVAMLAAIAAPLLAGAAGLGVETAFWFHKDLELQQAADKAVYAAALEKRAGSADTVIKVAATDIATKNGYAPGTLIVNYPPKNGTYKDNPKAIEVVLSRPLPRYFSGVFTDAPITDNARAVASMQDAGNACVLALNPSANRGVYVSGSANLSLTGCDVMSNSSKSDSIYVGGSAKLTSDCLIASGGIDLSKPANTTTSCTDRITNAPPVDDPFKDLPVPDIAGATVRANSNGAQLTPGNYKNGLDLKGTQTLKPGVYIVSGGSFSVNANANITGTGVTIYIAKGVNVSMNGNATIKLSAPTDKADPYAGILFFGDRTATGTVKLNGNASSLFTGSIYFAKQDVQYLGNFSGNGGCTRVVANTIDWSGNATIAQDCTAYGMKPVPVLQMVQLVE